MIFDAVKNECLAVAITDTGIWTSAARQTWTGAEDVALTQLTTKFPGQGAHTVVVHCAGGGSEAHDPAAQAPAPAPDPEPAGPCVPDPFDLNFPGAC